MRAVAKAIRLTGKGMLTIASDRRLRLPLTRYSTGRLRKTCSIPGLIESKGTRMARRPTTVSIITPLFSGRVVWMRQIGHQ
jgi:hypothetical protein